MAANATQDWLDGCKRLGLQPGWMGRTVRYSQGEATIVDFRPKRGRFQVVCKTAGGERVELNADAVVKQLGGK